MTDEDSGQKPPSDPVDIPSPVEEAPVRNGRDSDSEDNRQETKNLAQEVHWLQHATFWSQVGLGVIGIGALIIYYCQLQQMIQATKSTKDSVELARKNAHMDQRPWLGVSYEGNQKYTVGKPFAQLIHVADTGRTPAKNSHGQAVTLFLEKGDSLIFSYDHGTKIELGTMLPNAPPQDAISYLIPRGIPKGTPIQPLIFTKHMDEALKAGTGYIVVYGRLEYDSPFGTHHWIQFCAPNATARFSQRECTEYNDVDDNEEK